jgi:hypothetical protein
LYYERSRSHVVAFDSLGFESPLLRISNRATVDQAKTTFRITFNEVGTFGYVCRIYTWMKGEVTVYSDGCESPEVKTDKAQKFEELSLQSPKELNERLK